MRTRHLIAIAVATLAVSGFLFAKAAHIRLPQKCKASELIAVIEVFATKRGSATKPYREVATAKVVEIIKGHVDGAILHLDYDNGLTCPNIGYVRGERCLIFATKLPTGHFETYNTYYGKFIVTNDTVVGWEFEADKKLDAVRKEIRKHLH